jgi:hypothetical protein
LPGVVERRGFMEGPHIVLLHCFVVQDEYSGYYCLSLVSV